MLSRDEILERAKAVLDGKSRGYVDDAREFARYILGDEALRTMPPPSLNDCCSCGHARGSHLTEDPTGACAFSQCSCGRFVKWEA